MKKVAADTRSSILAAAAAEFAAHGFAGASVDDIAVRSQFNKAMIYYHFENKLGLYVEILRDVFRGLGARTAAIADSAASPAEKIGGFLDAFNEMAATHPYMPPMMMREMAEGAVRVDPDTLGLMARIFGSLRRILQDGVAQGAFRPANPVLTYFSLVTPVIFFHASAPIRRALDRQQFVPVGNIDASVFVAHQKAIVLAALQPCHDGTAAGRPARQTTGVTAKTRKRTRSTRPGDHA